MMEISTIRMRELHAVAREMSLTHADIKVFAMERFGRHSLKDMAEEEAVQLIMEWRREMRPPQQETPKMTMTRGFPKLLVPRPAQNTPKPAAQAAMTTTETMATGAKPPVMSPLRPADIPTAVIFSDPVANIFDADDADIDYIPDFVEEDAPIITRPLQPAVPKQAPLIVSPSRVGTAPLKTPHGGLHVPKVSTPFPRPPAPVAKPAAERSNGGFGRVPDPPMRAPVRAPQPVQKKVYGYIDPADIPF